MNNYQSNFNPKGETYATFYGGPAGPYLQALLAAGAKRQPAAQADIYEQLAVSRKATGERGLLVVAVATHGFNQEGQDYLVGADSRLGFITRTGIKVAEVFDEVTQAKAPRRLVLLDACRERLSRERAIGGVDPESAMGAAFARAIADAKGQVVLSGTTLSGYSYDDPSRGNGVFTGAILDGLRGAAPADERHFITSETLATYVNEQVLQWVRDNRPEHQSKSQGISRQIEGSIARLPLAIDPDGMRSDEQARQAEALRQLRDNIGGPITGSLYDVIERALAGPLSSGLRSALLDEIESLDGSDRLKRSLAYFVDEHRDELAASRPSPAPGPPVATVQPSPSPAVPAEAVEAALELSRADRRLIQLGLSAAGFDPGPADGLFGRGTRGAIGQWQASRGESVTGYLNAESAKLLLVSGAAREAQEQEAAGQAAVEAQEQARREAKAARLAEARRRQQKWESLGLVMVRVDGGSFVMGCQDGRDRYCSESKPAHRVQVRSFEIGKYEVTQALWEAVMGDNPRGFKDCARCPLETVSWDDVQAFLRKLSVETGAAYRLPTEAEWEYAAWGGQQSRGYRYAGSNNRDSVAWYHRNSGGKTHPVGQKQPNELGLHDMSGNVSERVQDCWNDDYNGAPIDGRAWEHGDCGMRVGRGGSCYYRRPRDLQVAGRSWSWTGYRSDALGFRINRPLVP